MEKSFRVSRNFVFLTHRWVKDDLWSFVSFSSEVLINQGDIIDRSETKDWRFLKNFLFFFAAAELLFWFLSFHCWPKSFLFNVQLIIIISFCSSYVLLVVITRKIWKSKNATIWRISKIFVSVSTSQEINILFYYLGDFQAVKFFCLLTNDFHSTFPFIANFYPTRHVAKSSVSIQGSVTSASAIKLISLSA